MLRDLFLKVGGEKAKKQKSQSMFITSFHLSDISMKIFFFFGETEKSVTRAVKIKNDHMKR